jgi:DNA ligase-4
VGADTYHLGLVFFDILLLDSVSLLSTPYAQRREALQSIIRPIPGKSMFAERVPIDLHFADEDRALSALEKIFQDVLNNRQEGIVLKAEEASYHDFRTPWVKLKKDYISGYGDTLDLVVVGAGWDKARARELRGHLPLVPCYFLLISF